MDTRRSITGYCVALASALVSWRTNKQSIVSRSSVESEYRSMASIVGEIQWLTYLLRDLHVDFRQPIDLWCDNKAALHIAANLVFHERTKHLEIDCHIVREKSREGMVLPHYIPLQSQLANSFTKSLGRPQFQELSFKLGLQDAHQSQLEEGVHKSVQ